MNRNYRRGKLGMSNAYMMEVLASAVAAQFVAWSPEIWTDCMALKTAYAQPVLTWTKSHPEKRTPKKKKKRKVM